MERSPMPNRAMAGALMRYLNHGIHPGGFLTALLENNLAEAIMRADGINRTLLAEWVEYIWWEIPADAWGSREKCRSWMEAGQKEPGRYFRDTEVEAEVSRLKEES